MNILQALDVAKRILEGKLANSVEIRMKGTWEIVITDQLLELMSFRGLVEIAEELKLALTLDEQELTLETEA